MPYYQACLDMWEIVFRDEFYTYVRVALHERMCGPSMNVRVGRYIRMCALTLLDVLAEMMIGNENHGGKGCFYQSNS